MEYRWIGNRVVRKDSYKKVRGETVYPFDLKFPGMLYAKILRSRYPHAKIKSIDTSKAESLPGVVAVLTHRDVPGENRYGIFVKDRPILADDKVRYLGDPVALVAAENPKIAEKAVKLIEVEYEPLPAVTSPAEALKPSAPKIHEGGNIARHTRIKRGDVEKAFREAAVIVENTYKTGAVDHVFLELEGGAATIDDEGRITVYAGGQSPYRDRDAICSALDLPQDMIRVVNPETGGAFGGKDDVSVQIHLALLALKTRRPVKLIWSREESMVAGYKRHPALIWMKTAANREGRLTAHQVKIIYDTGAYTSLGPAILDVAIENCPGPYRIPNIDIEATLVYTNNFVAGAFRGFGAPQVIFAVEQQMNMLAEKLGLDEIEFRLRNALRTGDVAAFGNRIETSIAVDKALRVAAGHPLWRERGRFKSDSSRPWLKRGVGVAASIKGYTIGALPDMGEVELRLREDEKFEVRAGSVEMGQGIKTVLAQIAAEALGCSIDRVEVVLADTGKTPYTTVTSASRMTFVAGNALLKAVEELVSKIKEVAAKELEEPVENLRLTENEILSEKTGKKLSLREILKSSEKLGVRLRALGRFDVPRAEPIEGSLEIPHLFFMDAVALALVEVDTLTGFTRVLKVVEIVDAGRVINPLAFEGQVCGGVVQGLGYALMEELKLRDGYLESRDLSTYLIPTAKDAPEIESIAVEYPEELGPYGAKGIGEITLIPVPPAIINAIYDAVGVRMKEIPATPEKLYFALKRAGKVYRGEMKRSGGE